MKIIVNERADLTGFAYSVYEFPFEVSMGIHSDDYDLTIDIDFYKSMRKDPYAIINGIINDLIEGSLISKFGIKQFAEYAGIYDIPKSGIEYIISDSQYEKELLIRYLGQFPETKHLLNLI